MKELIYRTIEESKSPDTDYPCESYTSFITKYNLKYTTDDYYIYVDYPKQQQGWILHISVIPVQLEKLLDIVIPEISKSKIPFKLIKNTLLHKDINNGHFGDYKIGKVITVYLENESVIGPLLEKLIPATKSFIGPQVSTDFPISNILFTRYGSFITQIEVDPFGNRVRLMKDPNGNVVLDKYYIPPISPYGINNPFTPFIQEMLELPKVFLIENKYMPVKLLKSDKKGDVLQALYFTKFFFPKWCIIKQGRKGLLIDKNGRDARSRLEWQSVVNFKFNKKIPTPLALDYFEDDRQSNLVFQFLKGGKDLKWVILKRSKCVAWFNLPLQIKLVFLDYLLQIVTSIKIIHDNGYVHRDITGTNFLVAKNNNVYLIDLELIYSINEKSPDPPFGIGTHGYMSPQQLSEEAPSTKDDIYSIGALMTMVFSSGAEPIQIIDFNKELFKAKLYLLLRDVRPINLILKCLSKNPIDRPNIEQVRVELQEYKLSLQKEINSDHNFHVKQSEIKNVITKWIETISGNLMSENNIWYSHIENEYGLDVYPMGNKHYFGSLYRGIGGPIWLLARLKESEYNISQVEYKISDAINYLSTEVFSRYNITTDSYYYGKAGYSLLLISSIKAGFIQHDENYGKLIEVGFENKSKKLDLIYGIAGQGLSLLQCVDFLNPSFSKGKFEIYNDAIVTSQLKNGAWAFSHEELGIHSTVNGLGHGIAGIIYYLLNYGKRYNDQKLVRRAEDGLTYLIKQHKKKDEFIYWTIDNKTKETGAWWCNGTPGIALCLLKAYEVTQDKKYMALAEKALRYHPKYLVHPSLSQCHGLSGLGEIYLEAYRITENEEWWDRANWIVSILYNFRKTDRSNNIFWLVDNPNFPTADFMIGTSGIIHFLLRFTTPKELSFPLFPKH